MSMPRRALWATVLTLALASLATGCADLTRPSPITISAEPLESPPVAAPAPVAPPAAPAAKAGTPAPAHTG